VQTSRTASTSRCRFPPPTTVDPVREFPAFMSGVEQVHQLSDRDALEDERARRPAEFDAGSPSSAPMSGAWTTVEGCTTRCGDLPPSRRSHHPVTCSWISGLRADREAGAPSACRHAGQGRPRPVQGVHRTGRTATAPGAARSAPPQEGETQPDRKPELASPDSSSQRRPASADLTEQPEGDP